MFFSFQGMHHVHHIIMYFYLSRVSQLPGPSSHNSNSQAMKIEGDDDRTRIAVVGLHYKNKI